MQLINLTPHKINIHGKTIDPTGYVSRVNNVQSQVDTVDGIPILVTTVTEATHLPEPEKGTYFIVPAIVRMSVPKRKDLLSPVKLIRNKDGDVVGCAAFERNA
jgi:hypothetical protein